MTTQINTYFNELESIVTDKDFILLSVETAKALGITAEEWNKNKMLYLVMFALEMKKRDKQ
jgi:RsiW-degrading membrane proteinase PrsW (M82 family)